MRRAFAEFLATFALVFAGTGAVVVNQTAAGHPLGQVGISAVFGLIVAAMIHTFGDISGAHMNPAVTLAFAVSGRFRWPEVPGYLVAQLLGACAASGVLRVMFPASEFLGATLPAGSEGQSFALELIMTALLMLVILSVATGAKEKGAAAGWVIGGVVALEALFGGPVSGASMNPARSLGPAVVSGHFEHLWLYLAATIAGALLALPLCMAVRGRGCFEDSTNPL